MLRCEYSGTVLSTRKVITSDYRKTVNIPWYSSFRCRVSYTTHKFMLEICTEIIYISSDSFCSIIYGHRKIWALYSIRFQGERIMFIAVIRWNKTEIFKKHNFPNNMSFCVKVTKEIGIKTIFSHSESEQADMLFQLVTTFVAYSTVSPCWRRCLLTKSGHESSSLIPCIQLSF